MVSFSIVTLFAVTLNSMSEPFTTLPFLFLPVTVVVSAPAPLIVTDLSTVIPGVDVTS